MSIYDGIKLDNSSYIPQYVGSVVPELANFSQVQQKRYNEARDTDDALTEALGNLQHLGLEGDTQYANELKQEYLAKLESRAGREDYENMGRRTKRDAQEFSSAYAPLVQRQKDLSAELERVQQDEKIFSPEKKSEIAGYISAMNDARRDANGQLERDGMGRIRLGAVQTWAYAKDVDINKKLADFLKAKETDISQSGFGANGRGLMTSVKRETRSPEEIGRLAKEMMETDPEIKAMVERDVNLATYRLTPAQMTAAANKANVSIYDKLKRQGLSDQMIKSNLKAHGISLETAKLKPVDVLRQDYIAKGRSAQLADADFVRNQVKKEITSPHVDLVANLLKVDRQTLEAREDPDYAAKALGAAIAAAMPSNSGEASPLIVTPDNSIAQIDATNLHNTLVENEQKAEEIKGNLQTYIGSAIGLPKPNGKNTPDWYNKTGRYINDRKAQGELIQKLQNSGRTQEAANLTQAFRQYENINNQAVYARQQSQAFSKLVDMKPIYNEYVKNESGKKLSYNEFVKTMTAPVKMTKRNLFGAEEYVRAEDGFVNRLLGRDEKYALKIARDKYFKKMQEAATQNGKSIQTSNTTFEPTSSGYLKNQTEFVENGLISGSVKGVDQATKESFDEIIRKELGSGWFHKTISDKDRRDPSSDYNKAMRLMKVRINADTRGANGEPTATVTTPSGAVRTIVLKNISPNLPTEMAARMLGGAGQYMTKEESKNLMQSSAMGAGWSQLKNINQAEIYNLRPAAKPYQLNDLYYLKVESAGVKGAGNSTPVYSLMVKDGDTYKRTKVSNRTRIDDIIQAIGGQYLRQQMTTVPSTSILER